MTIHAFARLAVVGVLLVGGLPQPSRAAAADTRRALTSGLWIDRAELKTLPMEGPAWDRLNGAAAHRCATPHLEDQDDRAGVCAFAKALVFARTDNASMKNDVVQALHAIIDMPPYRGRALALGRNLVSYVLAADLLDLTTTDPDLDARFRVRLRTLLITPTIDGPSSLVACHEQRPNNWGTHCGASRLAVAAYLGDSEQIARVATIFRGWLGERTAYAGFAYGDLSWQCNPSAPVAINPAGCVLGGRPVDGVLPDDQRRAGTFTWPPPKENYVYEALQGAVTQAAILQRLGNDSFEWGNKALVRAFTWLYTHDAFLPVRDDTWMPDVVNALAGTSFSAPSQDRPGKSVGWTDWTHASER